MIFALESVRVNPFMWQTCSQLKAEFPKEDFDNGQYPKAGEFMNHYIITGFKQLFIFGGDDEERRDVLIYIILYCFA